MAEELTPGRTREIAAAFSAGLRGLPSQKMSDCIKDGKHDTSRRDKFVYTSESRQVRGIRLSGYLTGVEVFGHCPHCGVSYNRAPTKEEMQDSMYQEMIQRVRDFPAELERELTTPMTI